MRFRWGICFSLLVWLTAVAQPALAQWQNGNLAIRTNGNQFQSGEQLRVELLALEDITEPFSAQVVYAYTETVTEKDDDGKDVTKSVERTRKRDAGPILNQMEALQSSLLDDRFHFGDGSPTGWYEVRVFIRQAYTSRLLTTLRTCVFYQNSGGEQQSEAYCGLFLRAFKRANNELFWTFSGSFKETGRYSVLLLRGGKVVRQFKGAGYANGPREFNVSANDLAGTSGQTYDILLHDHESGLSSTLAKAAIPEAQ